MTKHHSTKRSLIASILILCLCFTSLVGTTFAWFTDSVTSNGNVIKTGTLDVELYYADGKQNPASAAWNDASTGALYTADQLWEPGYTDAKHLKISNEGTLALKYQLAIIPTGEVSALANVIDVYYIENATAIAERDDLAAYAPVGTLADLINNGIKQGSLEAGTDYTATLVLKMQESAGNEYQELSIGSDFTIRILATQYTSESDSFGDDYDADAWVEGMLVYTASDLQAALNAGENVVLMNDITLSESIVVSANGESSFSMRSAPVAQVIDLNGKTIKGEMHKSAGAVIKNEGTLYLCNGTISSTAFNGGATIMNLGTVTVEDVTLNGAPNADGSWPSYTVNNKGVMTLNDCYVTSYHGAVASYTEGAVITMNDTDVSMAGITGYTNHALYTYDSGKIVVNSGNIANNAQDQSATGGSVINGNVEIFGGSFVGRIENYYGNPVIYGGSFSVQPKAEFLAEGFSVVNNSGDYVVLKGDTVASDNDGLNAAIENGESNIALGAGNYNMPATDGDVTITGTKDTVITINKPTANKVNLNGVTVVGSGNYTGIQHSDTVIYENCTVVGVQFLYANTVKFIDCVVDLTATPDYIWTYGAKNVEFIDCTFNTAGKAILIYNEGADLVTSVSVTGCTFNATGSALAGGKVAAAIEIDSSLSTNGHYTLTTANNIVDSDFSGEWRVKKSGTDNTTVNGVIYNKVAGTDGLYKGEAATYYVYNGDGLAALNTMMADKTAGRDTVVNLLCDIDFAGKVWTTVDSHADTAFEIAEINGNGHTIYNLTINGQAMFSRFAGSGDVVIKDITFDGANVNSNGSINTSILTVQSYQNVLLDNVDVKNSTISGGYKVAPLIATVYNENSSTTVTATLKDCDVENVVVKATSYDFCTAGMVAFVYAADNDKIEFESCTVTNVTIIAPNDIYKAHAAIYTTGSASLYNEVDGVTVTNVTFEGLE